MSTIFCLNKRQSSLDYFDVFYMSLTNGSIYLYFPSKNTQSQINNEMGLQYRTVHEDGRIWLITSIQRIVHMYNAYMLTEGIWKFVKVQRIPNLVHKSIQVLRDLSLLTLLISFFVPLIRRSLYACLELFAQISSILTKVQLWDVSKLLGSLSQSTLKILKISAS